MPWVMPKLPHEALVQLVRRAPEQILRLIWPTGQPPPRVSSVRVTAAEYVDLNLAEYRADVVLAVGEVPDRPEGVFVVEVQLQRDPKKREIWPVYGSGLRVRLGCPVAIVVIAPNREVARWCGERIDLGWGRFVLDPWVLGPDAIPVIDDPEKARAAPELALLSVAAHADEPIGEQVALATLAAARGLDDDRKSIYPELVFGLLGRHARTLMEKLMASADREFYSELFQEKFDAGKVEGKVEGKAETLLKLLAHKKIAVSRADRARIRGCTEPKVLDKWIARVLTAESVDEVLREPRQRRRLKH